MLSRVAAAAPEARLQGFTVQAMCRRPQAEELILGVIADPQFGPVMQFGQGGTAVEVINDKALALPPLDPLLVGFGGAGGRTEESRGGKACVGQFRSRWSPDQSKKNHSRIP